MQWINQVYKKFLLIWASQVLQEKCLMNYVMSNTETVKGTGSYNEDGCFFTHTALQFLNLNSKIHSFPVKLWQQNQISLGDTIYNLNLAHLIQTFTYTLLQKTWSLQGVLHSICHTYYTSFLKSGKF